MKYILLALLAAGTVMFSGCTAAKNIENSKQLRTGMSKSRVLEIMGEPLTEEEYNTPDVWYYYVETVWLDGLTTRDECMPVVFEEGKLVGWGNRFYTRYRSRGVRNARDITLTGTPADSTPREAQTEDLDDPDKEKKNAVPDILPVPAGEARTSEAVKSDAASQEAAVTAKTPEAVKSDAAAQEASANENTKKLVTVEDLVAEMENKK